VTYFSIIYFLNSVYVNALDLLKQALKPKKFEHLVYAILIAQTFYDIMRSCQVVEAKSLLMQSTLGKQNSFPNEVAKIIEP
jgi:hypothetical protein